MYKTKPDVSVEVGIEDISAGAEGTSSGDEHCLFFPNIGQSAECLLLDDIPKNRETTFPKVRKSPL